nr:HNH endonuclease signature motif containing protein [Janthinobacterium sp. NKUCC06_STL]
MRVRRETHTGLDRAWGKTAEPNVWRKWAVLVWEAEHGPVAPGLVIHHRDRDRLNGAPANLQALTRTEHADEHCGELEAARARNGANLAHEREVRMVEE